MNSWVFRGQTNCNLQKKIIEEMIIIEVSIYADGNAFPHIGKKYLIVIKNIIFYSMIRDNPYVRS